MRRYNQHEFEQIMLRLPKVRKSKSLYLFRIWYKVYLLTEYWQKIREMVLLRAYGTCEMCDKYSIDEVHHINYKNLGKEDLNNLIGLCMCCHRKMHGLGVDELHISHTLEKVMHDLYEVGIKNEDKINMQNQVQKMRKLRKEREE